MKKKKRRLKKKFVIFFSIYFVLFATFLVMKTYAKFSGTINKNGEMSVAKWDVSANLPEGSYTVEPVGDYTFNITVTSNSDVALTYDIKITNTSINSFVSLDGSKFSDCGNTYTFKNVGTIDANATDKTKHHTLKFIATPDVIEYTDRPVKIEVIFKQKKPS